VKLLGLLAEMKTGALKWAVRVGQGRSRSFPGVEEAVRCMAPAKKLLTSWSTNVHFGTVKKCEERQSVPAMS